MKPTSALPVALALALVACQEHDGPCPEIDDVTPTTANRAEVIQVTGRDFALGHSDLFDDGAAVPPRARLVVSPDLLEMFAPDMADQEIEFAVERVSFVSDRELEITMPDTDWNDLASGLELAGMDVEAPPLPVLPIPTVLHVENPTGCDAEWDGEVIFNLEVPQSGGEEGSP